MTTKFFTAPNIEEIHLPIEQFCVSSLLADEALEGLAPENLKLHLRYMVSYMARQITAMLTVPTYPIQDRVVCEYPASLWEHIKAKLGLKHNKTVVRFKELCVYPDMAVPPYVTASMRVYRHAGLTHVYDKQEKLA